MYYYDNPKGMIPTWLINWAAKVKYVGTHTNQRRGAIHQLIHICIVHALHVHVAIGVPANMFRYMYICMYSTSQKKRNVITIHNHYTTVQ